MRILRTILAQKPRGMATALALISLSSMLVISLVAVDLLTKGLVASGVTGRSSMAYLAAESGAEFVLWLTEHDSNFDEDAYGACTGGWLDIDYGTTACATGGVAHPHEIESGNVNYYYTVNYETQTVDGIPFHVFTLVGHYFDSRRSVEIRYVK